MTPTKTDFQNACELFRSAGQRISDSGKLSYFPPFPKGWCGTVSRALGAYLCELYPETTFYYVCGTRGNKSHAWVCANNTILDVTADQFDDCNEPVIVSQNSKFHRTFCVDKHDIRKIYPEDKMYPEEMTLYCEAKRILNETN